MKNILKKLIIVVLFIVVGCFIISNAPQYELNFKYKDGDLRVIINDIEITRDTARLPEVAALMKNEPMLSHNTIDILFDKDLYFEEKYNTFISTSNDHRANIKLGENLINIDGEYKNIGSPAQKTNYKYAEDDRYIGSNKEKTIYYLPIKAFEDVYNIKVEFTDKLIITSSNINLSSYKVSEDEEVAIKYMEDENSVSVDTAKVGDEVYLFNFDATKDFNKARSQNGEIGYVKTSILNPSSIVEVSKKAEKTEEKHQKFNLAWDYIGEAANSIGDMANRSKIKQLDVVCPTLLYFKDSTGEVFYKINALKEYRDWAKKNGYDVWITLKNDHIDIKELSEFLNDMHHRDKATKELIEICKDYNLQGINIDIENIYLDDATAFSQFIRELGVQTRKNNLVLSVCTNVPDGSDTWSKCYQHKSLSEAADYIAVMTYDYSKSTISANAPYNWVVENTKKLVERDGVPASKLLLGIPFYSYYWSKSGGAPKAYSMSDATKNINKATWDEENKIYFYETDKSCIYIEDKSSIKEKMKIIQEYDLAGSAIWRLGFETSDVWEAFEN